MTSKKQASKKNLYLTIVSYVKTHSKLPLFKSKQKRNYYVSELKKNKIIFKIGYGVWVVDWDKWEQFNYIKQVKNRHCVDKNIRGHGYHIRVRIPKLKNWDKRVDYLKKHKIDYKPIPQGQRILVNNHKIWLCNESIVIYYPEGLSFYGVSASFSEDQALIHLEKLLLRVESLFGCSFRINGKHQIRISKNHYAKVKDDLASECNKKGIKVKCYYNGENWLIIDHSLNTDELETLHPTTAKNDMDNVIVPFMNSIKNNPGVTIDVLKSLIYGVSSNQVMFDRNFQTHLEVINELKEAVKELRKEIKGKNG